MHGQYDAARGLRKVSLWRTWDGMAYLASAPMQGRARLTAEPLGVCVRALILLCALGGSGCAYHVFSPPARLLPLESAQVLPEGGSAVAFDLGHAGALFGPELSAVGVRYRRNVAAELDGVAEASLLHVRGSGPDTSNPNALTLRAGGKFGVWRHLALTFGAGGGASAAGGFVSPDLGLVLAFENRYFVPFVSVRGFASQPIHARRVRLGEDEDGYEQFGRPLLSFGFAAAAGVRIPLEHARDPASSVLLGVHGARISDGHEEFGFGGLGVGLELVL
jgi:hypothetical protein